AAVPCSFTDPLRLKPDSQFASPTPARSRKPLGSHKVASMILWLSNCISIPCSQVVNQRPTMTTLLPDLRFAVRQMRRSPGFAITAVLILALGIAANVIVFGVLQTIILQPLDVPNPDRVMTFAPHVSDYPIFAYPEVRDVRDGNTVFSAVAADTIQLFGLEADGVTRPAWGYE